MGIGDMARLFFLAAIWGGSFLFMRVLAPVLGPLPTANGRLLIGGGVLCLYYAFVKFKPNWKQNWRHYLLIGVANSAIPFVLYSFAALFLPASYEVILNTTTPLFGTFFAWLWLGESMNFKKTGGFLVAIVGVGLVVNVGSTQVSRQFVWAVLACLGATFCYGISGVYIKKYASHLKPLGIAGCSQIIAGLVLLPFSAFQVIPGPVDAKIIANLLGLGLVCSAIAYVLFYQLVARIGPAKTLNVAFLMPMFGMLWGAIFLHEVISVRMIAGTALIVGGILLITRKSPAKSQAA